MSGSSSQIAASLYSRNEDTMPPTSHRVEQTDTARFLYSVKMMER